MGNSYSNVGSPTAAGYVQAPELPLHLCFFLVVLLVFLGFSWYMSYESAAERFANQARLLLMASPLALLLTPRTLRHSSRRCSSRRWAQPGTVFTIPVFPEQQRPLPRRRLPRRLAATVTRTSIPGASGHARKTPTPSSSMSRGFRKEELKVLYNTSRKLKVAGERRADGGQWARFLKMFPVPRSCDAGAIRAVMDNEEALLYVILPKGSSSSSSSSRDKKEDEHNVSSQPQGEAAMAPMADGPSSSSGGGGNLYIAQEDEEMGKIDEKEEVIATQDVPRTHGDVDDGNGRWWQRVRPMNVLGVALILAVACVGAYVLCLMLL
ncbi:hypothetical protein OsJ_11957 [Oryza sativa Japonica Group]|uniref:SHSP domain-containing protein n=1 Tax=Oryza sativa subsp. japonica TaxID=39947 RepID=B9FA43_ORYSJ|nr:hypothetical protein OsJ_11957 [Oryza sativa Japonica Group]